MKLGTEVGLDPGDIVSDGDPAPPHKKGHSPHFSAMSIVAIRSPTSATPELLYLLTYLLSVCLLVIRRSVRRTDDD